MDLRTNERFQNILECLSKCKIDFLKSKDDCSKVHEINTKLETELKEARELEKSHRYHLLNSREMVGNLQETVSQLVYLKRDAKKIKEELNLKNETIADLEKEKEKIILKHNENLSELRIAHDKQIEELTALNEKKIQQVYQDSDTQIAQFTCVIEELRSKIKDMETENRDKMNVVVLEYEEKIQRGAAQVSQLQEQLSRQVARTDANIDAYRRRLEELEEKLKQSQFKQYLAQSSYPSQFESQMERPYSVTQDRYGSVDLDPVLENPKPKVQTSVQNKTPKTTNLQPLQVNYYGNKNANTQKCEKKGQFTITKKRKLYNDKDFQDF